MACGLILCHVHISLNWVWEETLYYGLGQRFEHTWHIPFMRLFNKSAIYRVCCVMLCAGRSLLILHCTLNTQCLQLKPITFSILSNFIWTFLEGEPFFFLEFQSISQFTACHQWMNIQHLNSFFLPIRYRPNIPNWMHRTQLEFAFQISNEQKNVIRNENRSTKSPKTTKTKAVLVQRLQTVTLFQNRNAN